MKVVFVGPSLPQARNYAAEDIIVRPPVCQGDIMSAVADGATAIGIIDGQFGDTAPVWHKEILFAISRNIVVIGASSMGALRACECAPFGMIGIGRIFDDYISGKRDDDADVALIHGPRELGYPALTIPMVSVDATIENALASELLDSEICALLLHAAHGIFFKERTWKAIIERAGLDVDTIKPIVDSCWTDAKRVDAIALLQRLQTVETNPKGCSWHFNATPLFRKLYM